MKKILSVIMLLACLMTTVTVGAEPQQTTKVISDAYTDLGLSVKWASCNVGANSPEEYGNYYDWDVAKSLSVKLPTEMQMKELVKKCTWEITILNGVSGVKITGHNGNSIFMPFACHDSSPINGYGKCGSYWSDTPYPESNSSAYCLIFCKDGSKGVSGYVLRSYKFYVRPIAEK
ncbi:MAG: hypothetical protein RR383_06370 [Muribaculaceae bacterium]